MAFELRASIDQGDFWQLDDAVALQLVAAAFSPELERLMHAPAAAESPGSDSAPSSQDTSFSPSVTLFGNDSDEVNRTLVSVLALRWIVNGDYEAFTAGQDSGIQLSPSSFRDLEKLFKDKLTHRSDQFALIVAIIVNDLGKDDKLGREVEEKTGHSCAGQNHDMILYKAVIAGIIPCIDHLDDQQKQDLILGIKMGAQLNLGQLAQAENVPGSLEIMLSMRGQEHAFDLKFLEQILDVAGAAGHIDHRCAKQLSEPVYQAFMTAYKVLNDIVQNRVNLRQGYDKVLQGRAALLKQKGFNALSTQVPAQRALLRLITMGRTTSKEQADIFSASFDSLPPQTRDLLVDGLNVDGYKDGKAILPYYMPALLASALRNTRDSPWKNKVAALASLMRFLTRVLDGTYPKPGSKGEVVEHDLMFAKTTISSAEFRRDPAVLDKLALSVGD